MFLDHLKVFYLFILSETITGISDGQTSSDDFHYTACLWKDSRCIQLDTSYFTSDNDVISNWPSGPYALLTPNEGCPETTAKGWRHGYISLTWKKRHTLMTTGKYKIWSKISKDMWPEIQSFLLGPFSEYAIRINFCYKTMNKTNVGYSVKWPGGSYTILGARNTCPKGFKSSEKQMKFPKLSSWTSYGVLPDFTITERVEDKSTLLTLKTCDHLADHLVANHNNIKKDNKLFNDPVVLLKSEQNISCPQFQGTVVTDEALGLKEYGTDNVEILDFLTVCFYRSKKLFRDSYATSLYDSSPPYVWQKAYRVLNPTLIYGHGRTKSRNNYLSGSEKQMRNIAGYQWETVPWLLVDLGRTTPVVGLQFRKIYKKFQEVVRPFSCFISNDRWRMDEFGAISCLKTDDFYHGILYYNFLKEVEGRYVKLVGYTGMDGSLFNRKMKNVNVKVLTTAKFMHHDNLCSSDLGMGDQSIQDFQLSASSWLPQLPPSFGRPFFPGWCSNASDKKPFITLDLTKNTRIDGITVFNWEHIEEDVNSSVYKKILTPVGSKKVMVSYSTDQNIGELRAHTNMTFSIDTFLPLEQPQKFLHNPVVARYVAVYILESMTPNANCLRFELHGCRQTGEREINHQPLLGLYTSKLITFNNIRTLSNTSIISSIGYPAHYPTGESYTWIIDMQNGKFIRLIFSKILFNVHEIHAWGQCRDTLKFLPGSYDDDSLIIDQSFNGFVSMVDTDLHYVALTFTTCRPTKKIYSVGNGFKVFVKTHDMPTCFSLRGRKDTKIQNNCMRPMMYLTSVARQNFPNSRMTEEWIINVARFSIHLQILYFNVRCDTGSEFHIIDRFSGGQTYCNLRMVPSEIYSNSGMLFIRFEKKYSEIKANALRMSAKEGFKAIYRTFQKTMEHLVDSHRTRGDALMKLAKLEHHRDMFETSTQLYTGKLNLTISGIPCQRWDSDTPHEHNHKFDSLFPDKTVNTAENYCRDPDASQTLWCYTQDPHVRSEVCWVEGSVKLAKLEQYWDKGWEHATHLTYTACSKRFGKCYFIYSGALTSWATAGAECWIRQMRLVSIHSDEEHELVKYILRNFRYFDLGHYILPNVFASDNVDPDYFIHIGLLRETSKAGRHRHVWEDGSPVTFSAWKAGEPSLEKDCTRMSFHLFNTNNTWESEDCEKGSTRYFICEHQLTPNLLNISDTNTHLYTGKLNLTLSGIPCQRWDSQIPHQHLYNRNEHFLDNTVSLAENYCRDPDFSGVIWCYTEDPHIRWEKCKAEGIFSEADNIQTALYDGYLSKTASGRTCQRWDKQNPHSHRYNRTMYFPDESLDIAANHCRDPSNEGILWCYTTDPKQKWETCYFKDTASDKCHSKLSQYAGKWNTTRSGKACQPWASQTPHAHSLFQDTQFPDRTVVEASNFCRDPYKEGYLWCFTMDPGIKTEPCVFEYKYSIKDETFNDSFLNSTFQCDNGDIIPQQYVCNGIPNCLDVTDENNCTQEVNVFIYTRGITTELQEINDVHSLFQCKSKEWISLLARCDGIVDCIDATDELNCSLNAVSKKHVCSTEEYTCDDGECIHVSQVCDFIADCKDKSDENCDFPLCSSTEYRCQNQQCIPIENKCDAFENCLDGTDESGCDVCGENTFQCEFKRCIPQRLVCDNYPDCEDGSDEMSCDPPIRHSCEEWWAAGYRRSGMYKLSNSDTEVECIFDHVLSDRHIYTIFHNFELTIRYNEEEIQSTDSSFIINRYFKNNSYFCTQNITQSCIPAHKAVADNEDLDHTDTYRHCGCLIMTIRPGRYSKTSSKVVECKGDETVADMDKLFFSYREYNSNGRITLKKDFSSDVEVNLGPAVCKHVSDVAESNVGCGDGNVFPSSVRCVYDTDPAGYILGCRSGQHLQDCELFECPANTFKCPDSYCLPLKFICDGVRHCPGAQDEQSCGCKDADREVVLLHEDRDDVDENTDFRRITSQFYTSKSVVRELRYKLKTKLDKLDFEHLILDISDVEINQYSTIDRQIACNYSILASDFINRIEFSKKNKTVLIFVQKGNASENLPTMIFGNLKSKPKFSIYRVLEESNNDADEREVFPFVQNVFVKSFTILKTFAAKFFPELCREAEAVYCPHEYRCAASKTCIQLEQFCDGHVQCVHGDDERLCHYSCPENCKCTEFTTDCSFANISVTTLAKLNIKSRWIGLSGNAGLKKSLTTTIWQFPFLIYLNLSNCDIQEIKANIFQSLVNLRILDLSFNRFSKIPHSAFIGLRRLKILNLFGNKKIYSLEPFSLNGLSSIKTFEIKGATIGKLSANAFYGLKLNKLVFSNNNIKDLEDRVFSGLNVKIINIENNTIANFDQGLFQGVSGMTSLHTPAFRFCCVRPNYLEEENCFPQKDEFSSCDDLLRLPALQTMMWLVGIIAFSGNSLSILYGLVYDRKRLKLGYGMFVTNLAAADFLMGIYLLIIAIADAIFRKRYIFYDNYWRNSVWCTLAGFLATVSSEASVFFVSLITLDRLLVIKYPFGQVRFDAKKSGVVCFVSWTIAISIGLIPILFSDYFHSRFYSNSGVCIALPLKRDQSTGWLYSVIIFIGLNFVTFCLIGIGQIVIYREMKKATAGLRQFSPRNDKGKMGRRREIAVARNLLLVVATDFLCWFPIGCMGLLLLSGHVIPGDVYAWTAVFILPVNSALNPVLYTLTAFIGKRKAESQKDKNENPLRLNRVPKKVQPFNGLFRYFITQNDSPGQTFVSLNDVLKEDMTIKTKDVLKMSLHLTQSLRLLHKNSLVLKKLNGSIVYTPVQRGKIIGDIQLRQEPVVCCSNEEKREDMYMLGQVLRCLLAKRNKQINATP